MNTNAMTAWARTIARTLGLAAVLTALGTPMATAQAAPVLRVSPHDATVANGGLTAVDIWVDDVQDLYAFNFSLSFDPAALGLLSIIEGDFLSSGGATVFIPGLDDGAGLVSFTGGSLAGAVPGADGSGIVATFNFLAVGLGTAELVLSDALLLDSQFADISASLVNARLQVTPGTPLPTPGSLVLVVSSLLAAAAALWLRRRQYPRWT